MMIAKKASCLLAVLALLLCACNSENSTTIIQDDSSSPDLKVRSNRIAMIPHLISATMTTGAVVKSYIHQKKAEKKLEIESMAEINELLAPPTQTFYIESNRDTIISCQSGTHVFLPADIFDLEKPQEVEITIEEYYSNSELLSRNLSTIAGDELLETGGTIKLEAEDESGNDVQMKDEEAMIVLFPRSSEVEDMEAFYGEYDENDQMNWVEDQSVDPPLPAEELTEELKPVIKIGPGGKLSPYDKPEWGLRLRKETFFEYFEEHINKLPEAEPLINELSFAMTRCGARINTNNDGRIEEVKFYGISDWNKPFLEDFLKNMPPIDMKSMHQANYGSYTMRFWGSAEADREKYKQRFRTKYAEYKGRVMDEMPFAELEYFVLASTQTGWINCDRYAAPTAERQELVVMTEYNPTIRLFMVFEEFDAIVGAAPKGLGQFSFKSAPLGAKVKMIALKFEGNLPMVSSTKHTIGEDAVIIDNYKSFTLDELEAMLN